jgi:hypothetical protein
MYNMNNSLFMDNFRQKTNAELIDLVKKEKYSQHMTLAGIEIGPLVNENKLPKNHHLFPIFNYLNKLSLADTICMNIGACDGMTAFSLASRGAKRVDATCQYDLDRFRIARALGRYRNIAYYPKTDLDKIHLYKCKVSKDFGTRKAHTHAIIK